ncbi:hypothetical protein L3Q82_000513 [Scortum barcoo]|uniref:Uncharacterized protein n=1 Tax=Scortum barcoo TaxID=214431 RepID=A0ACB8WI35_9TELE|nr:hypothetical protein L3Q82_000513 [Scortum barcoo]
MELPGNFESLVDMATRIDNRLQERERERRQQIRRSSESQEVGGATRVLGIQEINPVIYPGASAICCSRGTHASRQGKVGSRGTSPEVERGSLFLLRQTRGPRSTGEPIPNPSDYPDISKVPPCYHDLKEVFNKAKATSLPPHREWDCAIDLLPGAPIPKARLYSISGPERKAMEEYIEASLRSGIIRPSSSPAGAGFFSVVRLLQQAKIFTKLDLRNAYHLVRIREGDEWKTGFNTPQGHYEYLVMPFGLTNAPAVFQSFINEILREYLNDFVFVYLDDTLIFSPDLATHQRHVRQVLIRLLENQLYAKAEKCDFHASSVTFLGYVITANHVSMDPAKVSAVTNWPPLTTRKKSFSGLPRPEEAFQRLKRLFTTAPVLTVPDPALQFVVEVDASNEGVGAVLSQRSATDNCIHPCAFLSRKLTPAERNYDVGNKELLAIKVALKEWRHWLEGAEQPFIVWTDHKNLQYLKSAKRLNSRQARWALFFSRFRFTLSYRPGSQNGKPDTLSRLYAPEPTAKEPETITRPCGRIGDLADRKGCAASESWRNNLLRAALRQRNRLYVPEALRGRVIHWAHTLLLTCHPGVKRTVFVVQQRFWWPSITKDVAEYVKACSVCARGKASRQARMGLLQPLPVPHRPWSHISLDFITGLLPSQGNTVVLTVVDRPVLQNDTLHSTTKANHSQANCTNYDKPSFSHPRSSL